MKDDHDTEVRVKSSKRPRGTGSLYVLNGSWYGSWRVDGRQVKRRLGPCRKPGTAEGLTKTQAEARLRRMMHETRLVSMVQERVTVEDAGGRFIAHVESLGRKPSTIDDYKSILRVHLQPHFGSKALVRITPGDVEAYIAAKHRARQAPKTTLNQLGVLNSIFDFARRRGWTNENPCTRVDKPQKPESQPLRFLNDSELDALLAATRDPIDRAIFLTAAMTGLRRGELLALRWGDIDFTAKRVRVRENLVRGRLGRPKSKRSSRSVPMARRVAAELDQHFKRSRFQRDDDLVFPHPLGATARTGPGATA